ncbi:hypothetical protein V5799_017399 [Amblyomma americanum]|uniref:Uncharacterized protein n=1 Tax=Amblyomma americanum TaxID=6943 RepID=A0AAQ4F282_AMBAM
MNIFAHPQILGRDSLQLQRPVTVVTASPSRPEISSKTLQGAPEPRRPLEGMLVVSSTDPLVVVLQNSARLAVAVVVSVEAVAAQSPPPPPCL